MCLHICLFICLVYVYLHTWVWVWALLACGCQRITCGRSLHRFPGSNLGMRLGGRSLYLWAIFPYNSDIIFLWEMGRTDIKHRLLLLKITDSQDMKCQALQVKYWLQQRMLTDNQLTLIDISELDNATTYGWEHCPRGAKDSSMRKQWAVWTHKWAWLPRGFSQVSDGTFNQRIQCCKVLMPSLQGLLIFLLQWNGGY